MVRAHTIKKNKMYNSTKKATSLVEVLMALTIFAILIIYFLQLASYALHRSVVLHYKRQQYNAAVALGHIVYEVTFRDYANTNLAGVLKDGLVIIKHGNRYEFDGNNPTCTLIGSRVSASCRTLEVVTDLGQVMSRFGYFIDITYSPPAYIVDITVACKEGITECDDRLYPPVVIRRYILK